MKKSAFASRFKQPAGSASRPYNFAGDLGALPWEVHRHNAAQCAQNTSGMAERQQCCYQLMLTKHRATSHLLQVALQPSALLREGVVGSARHGNWR